VITVWKALKAAKKQNEKKDAELQVDDGVNSGEAEAHARPHLLPKRKRKS